MSKIAQKIVEFWLLKKPPLCVKCDCAIIDECGVFDGPNGKACWECHEEGS